MQFLRPASWGALTLALACNLASPALAEWYEASSDHFVIYADDDEAEVRLFAENLERYHSAMENFTERNIGKPSPSNRITVYAVGSEDKVRALAGSTGVAGFYLPRAHGSVAFVQDIKNKEGYPDVSTTILLHEYAHHFLSSTDRYARPLWMNEGAAEFFSNAYFHEDGSVFLGTARNPRSFIIFWKEDEITPVREVIDLTWDRLSARNAKSKNSFYGRSWLLYHYLTMTPEREGQLREYWLEVLKGTDSLEAGKKVFGDMGLLERQLNRYFRNRERKSWRVEAEKIKVSPIEVRPLTEGEVAMMETRIRIERGVPAEEARNLAAEARGIAAAYSDDPTVWAVLARAELDGGDNPAAQDAANRALAIEPDHPDALMLKGIAGFRMAREIQDPAARDAAYLEAMKPLSALNALEANHTVPLIYSYRLDAERGVPPSSDAKAALARAAELAPFDQELWLITGMMHMNDGRIAEARAALQPIASNPHGGEKAEQIRNLLAFLSDKQEGQPIPVQAAISGYFTSE